MDLTFFGGKYKLEQELAVGGCGTVFIGVHTIAGKEVAIKLEPVLNTTSTPATTTNAHNKKGGASVPANNNNVSRHISPLKQESKIYKTLMGAPGVPWIMWSGKQGDYNVLVLDLLGPSLDDLFKMCHCKFSLKTVLLLADQLLSRIEFIHSRDLLHRDVKPANFVMGTARGTGNSHHTVVNVIDFGFAKRYRDPLTGAHIPYNQDVEGRHGVGTSLFAAIHAHLGIESSRRDDLESLAYMLIYFLRGTLPWRRLRGPTVSATWDLIRDKKLECEALLTVGLPREVDVLYRYARGLAFEDLPDYKGLREMLRGLGQRRGISYDGVFDWGSASRWGKSGGAAGRGNGSGRCRTCEACDQKNQ